MTENLDRQTPEMTAQQAREDLAVAEGTPITGRADARRLAHALLGIGLAVAALLAASRAFTANGNTVGVVVSLAAYMAVLGSLVGAQRTVKAVPRGYRRRYLTGLMLTMALYTFGILWFSVLQDPAPSWTVFGPYCLLTALPSLLAAARIRELAGR